MVHTRHENMAHMARIAHMTMAVGAGVGDGVSWWQLNFVDVSLSIDTEFIISVVSWMVVDFTDINGKSWKG